MTKRSIILRASAMLVAISGLVAGVTYASLTTTATLTGNTFASATAELFVSSDGSTPTGNTATGFTVSGLVPGAGPSAPQTFKLKNNGEVGLGVTVYATPSVVTGTLNNSKVHFCFTKTSGPSTDCFTYAQMLAVFNTMPGGPLAADDTQDYTLTIEMDADAVTGGSASVAPFDLVFTGTQQ